MKLDSQLTKTIREYVESNNDLAGKCTYLNNEDDAVHYSASDNPKGVKEIIVIYESMGDCFAVSLFGEGKKFINYLPCLYDVNLASAILEEVWG